MMTRDPAVILSAEKVLFPGVGNAWYAMNKIRSLGLDTVIPQCKQPFLGICLGMQLLFDYSEESDTECLGIIPGKVCKFKAPNTNYRIPHMWRNSVAYTKDRADCDGDYYFVHSYYAAMWAYTLGTVNYIQDCSAMVQYNNFYGVQFHPEKSWPRGAYFLKKFLDLPVTNVL